MIVASALGVVFASFQRDILSLLVFVGALWEAIVFPVIASFYWPRVTANAFTCSVLVAVTLFIVCRFELVALHGVAGAAFEATAATGAGVVLGLMSFGFFGLRVGVCTARNISISI